MEKHRFLDPRHLAGGAGLRRLRGRGVSLKNRYKTAEERVGYKDQTCQSINRARSRNTQNLLKTNWKPRFCQNLSKTNGKSTICIFLKRITNQWENLDFAKTCQKPMENLSKTCQKPIFQNGAENVNLAHIYIYIYTLNRGSETPSKTNKKNIGFRSRKR